MPEVVSAATVTGTSDAILHVLARDMRHLEAALERIRSSADIERSESIVVLSNLIDRMRPSGESALANQTPPAATAMRSAAGEMHRATAGFARGRNWPGRASAASAGAGAGHADPDPSSGCRLRSGRRSDRRAPTGRRAGTSGRPLRPSPLAARWRTPGSVQVPGSSKVRTSFHRCPAPAGNIVDADHQPLEVGARRGPGPGYAAAQADSPSASGGAPGPRRRYLLRACCRGS